MDLSDEQLLERYIAGRDDRAFGVLADRYLDMVHAVARRVTENDEMARDVAQAVFIRLAAQAACLPQGVAAPEREIRQAGEARPFPRERYQQGEDRGSRRPLRPEEGGVRS